MSQQELVATRSSELQAVIGPPRRPRRSPHGKSRRSL